VVLHSRFEGADTAADIIGAGPEPLTSQFAAGYGMVLNLLHTRSLDDARAFLERSFGNYMGMPMVVPCLSCKMHAWVCHAGPQCQDPADGHAACRGRAVPSSCKSAILRMCESRAPRRRRWARAAAAGHSAPGGAGRGSRSRARCA